MLELVAQSVAQRGHDTRTAECDLVSDFGVKLFYTHILRAPDKNYITVSAKDAPTGLSGDTTLYASPAWSLLRHRSTADLPPELQDRSSAAIEQRIGRGLRLAPGGYTLPQEDKGTDVTRVFMKNVQAPAARPGGVTGGQASGSGGGAPSSGTAGASAGGPATGKRRLVLTNFGGGGRGARGGAGAGAAGGGGGGGGAAGGGADGGPGDDRVSSGGELGQQHSGDTVSLVSHDSKRQRSYY